MTEEVASVNIHESENDSPQLVDSIEQEKLSQALSKSQSFKHDEDSETQNLDKDSIENVDINNSESQEKEIKAYNKSLEIEPVKNYSASSEHECDTDQKLDNVRDIFLYSFTVYTVYILKRSCMQTNKF